MFSVGLQPQLANIAPTSQVKLRLEAAMSTTGFANLILSYLGVPIIEQKIGGHISTVTGQNSTKLGRLDG